MANVLVQPYRGPLSVDLQPLSEVLVDIAAGGTRGLRREQPGLDGVTEELGKSLPGLAQTIGLSAEMYPRFVQMNEKLAGVRAARRTLAKLTEILEETEAFLEDQREAEIGVIVSAVRTTARRKDASVLAAFEKTIGYHGQIAMRAAKTRRKNAEAAEAANDGSPDEEEPTPPAPPAPPA